MWRKPFIFCIVFIAVTGVPFVFAKSSEKIPGSTIETVFVLDTTGSMTGLIEGAKLKIWSIANEMASARPSPELRIGLVAYRDRGDAYVTRLFDLTDDLDAVYEKLMGFSAHGGGDPPESVNQALHEAVTRLSWSENPNVLKIVFLVGDAPPHMDYKDDKKYFDTCREAVAKDLIVNTIQCGQNSATKPLWKEIAKLGEGKYVQIAQSGGMQTVETPFDADLARLNDEMAGTAIVYGRPELRKEAAGKIEAAREAPAPAKADRLMYMSRSKKALTGGGDLLSDVEEGKADIEHVDKNELPPEIRNMTPEKRKVYIQKKGEERKKIQEKIDALLKKRLEYIKRMKKGAPDAFDEQVKEMIRVQGRKKGFTF